jgi:hypothetical protein
MVQYLFASRSRSLLIRDLIPPPPPDSPPVTIGLIPEDRLTLILEDADPNERQRIIENIRYGEYELMPIFRVRDWSARRFQYEYRRNHLRATWLWRLLILTAALTALFANTSPFLAPFPSGATAILAAVIWLLIRRESDAQRAAWIIHRRTVEMLRREYFRFITELPPYMDMDTLDRRLLFSRRVNTINAGVAPVETQP